MSDEIALDPETLSELFARSEYASFGGFVLDQAKGLGPVREVFVFQWAETALPRLLAIAGMSGDFEQRARTYLARYIHHDPMIFAHRQTELGTGFSESYRVHEIAPLEYRRTCFERPGFVRKLSFGWRWPRSLAIVNFYLGREDPLAGGRLAPLASAVLATTRPRDFLMLSRGHPGRPSYEGLQERLRGKFPHLSPRESVVCAMTACGLDGTAIAQELNVGPNSIYTYRRRAYQKLGISRAGEIVSLLF